LNCKPATYRRYASSLTNHLVPAFGTTRLPAISKEQVRQVAYRLRERLAPKGVTLVLAVLRSIMQQAVDDEILPSNPVTRIGKHLPRRPTPSAVQALTSEELAHLLTTIQTHRPAYYPLFLTLARTGMRIGEALALQWGDIDWRSHTIHVQRSYSGRRIGTPKNGKTRRVDMSTQLTEVLRQVLVERRTETLQRPEWQGLPPWVFCSSTGGLLDESALRHRVWVPCLARARLRHLRIHDVRHTYASLLIQQGESLAYVRDQLGHYSIKLTVDTYGHLVPGGNRQAVDRLDDTAPLRNAHATGSVPVRGRPARTA
jgi:integrase